MRKQVILYDDQYAFYKELKSPKLMIAFVEYMFEDVEPTWFNSLEQTIRNSLLVRMNNQKWKSKAWATSRWWWRPRKNNEKTTEKQQKNNKKTTKKQEDKDILSNDNILREREEDKEKENILSSNEDNSEAEYWNKEINLIIEWVKAECNRLGVAYDKTKDREFAKFIASAKEYWGFCEKIWQWRLEFAINVLRASVQIKFWKWVCAWPKSIYQNYAEVYNETMKQKAKAKTIPKF